MRPAALLACAVYCVAAFPGSLPGQKSSGASDGGKVDAQLHSDVVKLIELDGTKQRLQGNLKNIIASGAAQLRQQAPSCNATFVDEWSKRMAERINVDDFVTVVEGVFEKYFNDSEIRQLIEVRRSKETAHPVALSQELKQKLDKIMPSVQSEIMGGCVQVGTKVGSEVGQEIDKEHPEYCKQPAPAKE